MKLNETQERIHDIVNDETREELLTFTILWNLFERNYYATNYSENRMLGMNSCVKFIEKQSKGNQVIEIIKKIKDYNRKYRDSIDKVYLVKEKNWERFNFLYNATDIELMIELGIELCFRVRCNMFHGPKDVYELNDQTELFKNINSFLELFINV